MDDNADAKILLTSPPADWRRQLGRPRITWLSTIQQDLKHHHLTLPEAADLAQNRSLWRMMSTYGAMQSRVARQKRRFIGWLVGLYVTRFIGWLVGLYVTRFIGWLVGLYVTRFPQMLRINFHKILRVRTWEKTIWRWHRSRCMGYFKSNIRNCPSSDIQLRKILPVYYYLLLARHSWRRFEFSEFSLVLSCNCSHAQCTRGHQFHNPPAETVRWPTWTANKITNTMYSNLQGTCTASIDFNPKILTHFHLKTSVIPRQTTAMKKQQTIH